jgi:hypothetical protein
MPSSLCCRSCGAVRTIGARAPAWSATPPLAARRSAPADRHGPGGCRRDGRGPVTSCSSWPPAGGAAPARLSTRRMYAIRSQHRGAKRSSRGCRRPRRTGRAARPPGGPCRRHVAAQGGGVPIDQVHHAPHQIQLDSAVGMLSALDGADVVLLALVNPQDDGPHGIGGHRPSLLRRRLVWCGNSIPGPFLAVAWLECQESSRGWSYRTIRGGSRTVTVVPAPPTLAIALVPHPRAQCGNPQVVKNSARRAGLPSYSPRQTEVRVSGAVSRTPRISMQRWCASR